MSAQTQLDLTPEEIEAIETQARSRGFTSATAYLRELVKADLEQQDESLSNDEDEGNPVEAFRLAWERIQRGETISVEEFLKVTSFFGEQ